VAGEAFWDWVCKNSERLFQATESEAQAVVTEMGEVLGEEHPGLFCEVCRAKEDPLAELIVTGDGRAQHIPTVEAVVEAAPDLPRWKVTAFRQRADIGGIGIRMNGGDLKAEDVFFRVFDGPRGELGLTLYVRGLEDVDSDPRTGIAIILMDHAIGEYDAMTAIQSLMVEPLPEEADDAYQPLAALPGVIDAVKDTGFDTWNVYMTSLDEEGNPATVFVKMGLASVAPQAKRPSLCRVIVPLQSAREDGLIGDPGESEQLFELEEALIEQLTSECDALFVGRVTTCGVRDFAFYAPEGEMLEAHAQRALGSYPQYEPDVQLRQDAEWGFYADILLPSAFESLQISVDRRLRALREEGDDMTAPRPLEFGVAFQTPEARATFVADLGTDTFEISQDDASDGEDERPSVDLRVTSSAEPAVVHALVRQIYSHLQETPGWVHGWSCPPAEA
jgi:hypothetical protein